jgi:hypothetical protein
MPLNSVYIEHYDENVPETSMLKLSFSPRGNEVGSGKYMPPVIFFAIGERDESTYEDSFKSSADQQFGITREDLLRALIGLGVLDSVADLREEVEAKAHAA